MRTDRTRRRGGFTLLEVMMALAVFMLAVVGIAKAIDTALQAGIEARSRAQCRQQLESRLAYCLADPPPPGPTRVIEAAKNRGVRVEESLEPFAARNAKGQEIQGLKKLVIKTISGNQSESAEILLNHP
jgi:prepilin-type N-terminal cleavage/methylation domain-containing protein